MKANRSKSNIKNSLNQAFKKIIYKEILVDGQEPGKSYAYEKKYLDYAQIVILI